MDKRLHIFRPGRHVSMGGQAIVFTEADLAATARAYDPKLHEAPIVIGHPKTDGPAHGWVSGLAADDSGLHATPSQVEPTFAEAVEAGRYKKVSAAFYPPDHPTNPVPGVYYLRHVGFLGAQPPAVKGLKPAEFADDGTGLVEIAFGDWTDGAIGRALRQLREWFIGKFGLEEADKALPGWTADSLIEASVTPDRGAGMGAVYSESDIPSPAPSAATPETPTMTPEQIQQAQQQLAADQAAFAKREAKLKDLEAKAAWSAARAEAVQFAEGLEKEGRLLPAQKNRVVELLATVGTLSTELAFAEGDQTVKATPADALRAFLKTLPKQVEFGELAGGGDAERGAAATPVPPGYRVDPARAAKHREALAYAETHNVDYVTAAQAVGA